MVELESLITLTILVAVVDDNEVLFSLYIKHLQQLAPQLLHQELDELLDEVVPPLVQMGMPELLYKYQ